MRASCYEWSARHVRVRSAWPFSMRFSPSLSAGSNASKCTSHTSTSTSPPTHTLSPASPSATRQLTIVPCPLVPLSLCPPLPTSSPLPPSSAEELYLQTWKRQADAAEQAIASRTRPMQDNDDGMGGGGMGGGKRKRDIHDTGDGRARL